MLLQLKRSAPCRNSYDMESMMKDKNNTARRKLNKKLRAKQRAEDIVLFKEKETAKKRRSIENEKIRGRELYKDKETNKKKLQKKKREQRVMNCTN